jgi:hypothetical protein
MARHLDATSILMGQVLSAIAVGITQCYLHHVEITHCFRMEPRKNYNLDTYIWVKTLVNRPKATAADSCSIVLYGVWKEAATGEYPGRMYQCGK